MDTETITVDDVLVLGTDGLWDVVTNDEVAAIVARGLQAWGNESRAVKYRYISLAQVGWWGSTAGHVTDWGVAGPGHGCQGET